MHGESDREIVEVKKIMKMGGGIIMSEKVKSKTDVSSRTEAKNRLHNCRFCGNKVEAVMTVTPSGKKKMKRICCEN